MNVSAASDRPLREARPPAIHIGDAGGKWWPPILSVVIFAAATAATVVAQQAGRPITAVTIYLVGVTLVGAIQGLKGGLAAAIVASLVYNFFLSNPIFRFSLSSADEYVPLIAFNLGAIASALLAGRLKDEALAAHLANTRLQALLEFSRELQRATEIADIPPAVAKFASLPDLMPIELYAVEGPHISAAQPERCGEELARHLISMALATERAGVLQAFTLASASAPLGVLVLPHSVASRWSRGDTDALLSLLTITVERCLLLRQLSEAELLRRSEQFKTALLSSVSHDMRTPLSAISASASSLASYGTELPQHVRADLLSMIQEQCERLNRYTANLLNLTRLQGGIDPEDFVTCDALDVLGTAIARARLIADDLDIRKSYSTDVALVRADPVMLEQAFYNILENAVRYRTPDTPVLVSADLEAGNYEITVRNVGEDMSDDEMARIFDRFYRSRSSSGQEGSGLGLSIAKGFTEAFGGSISADRSYSGGHGIVLKVSLPAKCMGGEQS